MDLVEYVFGTGEGDPTTWVSATDLALGDAGGPDAVSLDFDGDGLRDDALWDRDGDGYAEWSVLDVGSEDARYFTDPGGAGTWAVETPLPRADPGGAPPAPDTYPEPAVARADSSSALADFTGDGSADDLLVDTDGDGVPNVVVVPRGGSVTDLFVDSDDDGSMDVRLTDSDGDGRLDVRAPSVIA